jgi:rare lipoprotein A
MKVDGVTPKPEGLRERKDPGKEKPPDDFPARLQASLQNNAAIQPAGEEAVREYTVKRGDNLWKIDKKMFHVDWRKIARDNGISNPDRIYPGQKLLIRKEPAREPEPVEPSSRAVVASWYGGSYHNKPTASGERFDMYKNTIAHKSLPFGTVVRLTNPQNGQTAVARINDRGPFIRGRDVDLSYALAGQLGLVEKGIGRLIMEILS